MQRKMIVFSSGALLLLALAGCEEAPAQYSDSIADRLRSEDAARRAEMLAELTQVRRQVIDSSLSSFLEGKAELDYDGVGHQAIKLAGDWRLEEAIPQLAKRIDLSIDPAQIPAGIKAASWSFYPSVVALRQIGGPTVRAAMLQKIQEPGDPRLLEFYAFVLSEIEGPEAATIHLAIAAERVGAEAARARCESASEAIAAGIQLAPPTR